MEEDDEMIQNMSQSDLIRHIASQVQANVARRGAGRGALRGTGRGAGRGAHNASMPRNLFLPITIIKITAVLHHPNGNQEFSEESWGGGIMVKGFVLKKVKDWQLEKAVEPLFVWVEEDGREVDYEEALKPDATYAFHYAHGFDFKYHTVNYVRYNRDLGRDEKPGFPIPQNQRWQRRRETPAPTAPQIPPGGPEKKDDEEPPSKKSSPGPEVFYVLVNEAPKPQNANSSEESSTDAFLDQLDATSRQAIGNLVAGNPAFMKSILSTMKAHFVDNLIPHLDVLWDLIQVRRKQLVSLGETINLINAVIGDMQGMM